MNDEICDREADAHFEAEHRKEQEAQENCEHKWTWHTNPSTPNGLEEHIKCCGLCGMEYPGSFSE